MKYLELCCLCSLTTILILSGPLPSYGSIEKVLHVGEELFKETLSLQNGDCLYRLGGLRPNTWYEVKISYPASIPASFSLELSRGILDTGLNHGRKLLNTEKLIFKTDGISSLNEKGEMYVLVNVEPEGVVAIPGKQEREYVMFNIVCDELFLGIPSRLGTLWFWYWFAWCSHLLFHLFFPHFCCPTIKTNYYLIGLLPRIHKVFSNYVPTFSMFARDCSFCCVKYFFDVAGIP